MEIPQKIPPQYIFLAPPVYIAPGYIHHQTEEVEGANLRGRLAPKVGTRGVGTPLGAPHYLVPMVPPTTLKGDAALALTRR